LNICLMLLEPLLALALNFITDKFISFIFLCSQLEHRAPFGVSVITHTKKRLRPVDVNEQFP
jgi:hypothetical protein